jgi:hypothetical protein
VIEHIGELRQRHALDRPCTVIATCARPHTRPHTMHGAMPMRMIRAVAIHTPMMRVRGLQLLSSSACTGHRPALATDSQLLHGWSVRAQSSPMRRRVTQVRINS